MKVIIKYKVKSISNRSIHEMNFNLLITAWLPPACFIMQQSD